jgi:hypothetical protein
MTEFNTHPPIPEIDDESDRLDSEIFVQPPLFEKGSFVESEELNFEEEDEYTLEEKRSTIRKKNEC